MSRQNLLKIYAPAIVVICLVILTVTTGTLSYLSVYSESINTITQQNHALVNNLNGWLGIKANRVEENALILRELDMDMDMLTHYFGLQAETMEDVSIAFVGFPDGQIIFGGDWEDAEDVLITTRPWYVVAAQNPGQVVFSRPYMGAATGQWAFAAARTVCNYDDSLGVVALSIPFDAMSDFVEREMQMHSVAYFVADRYGDVLFTSVSDFAPLSDSVFPNFFEIHDGMYAQMFETIKTCGLFQGGDMVFFGVEIPVTGWYLTIGKPLSNIRRNILPTITALASTSIFSFIVLLVMWLAVKRIRMSARNEREANELYEVFVNSSPYIMTIWDRDGIVTTNQRSAEMFGFADTSEYIERFNQLSPKYQPCGNPSSELVRQNIYKALISEDPIKFDWLHISPKGEFIPAEVTLVRFMLNRKYMVAAYTADMRLVKAAMEKERKSNELTKAILDYAPLMVEIWDKNNDLILCNQKTLDIFGCESVEEYKSRYYEFCPDLQPCGTPSPELNDYYAQQTINNGISMHTWLHQLADGTPMPTDVTCVATRLDDELIIIGYTIDLREITNALEKERLAEEANHAKNQFLARMSHEIRTPMNSILGISEQELQKSIHSPEVDEAFSRIYSASRLLLNIINDILDLSKVEAGKMEIISDAYEITSLIADTVQLNVMYIGSKRIEFKLKVDEDLPVFLVGDELRLKQILNNILSNAFKYTSEGEVVLTFGIGEPTDSSDFNLVLAVSDTGQGMTEEQVENLFRSEYTRFNTKQNRGVEGSGLGLAITYSLVAMMGGGMSVSSRKDKGTTFTLTIPQKRKDVRVSGRDLAEKLQTFEIAKKYQKENVAIEYEPMPYGRVLVVDDVESNLYVIKGYLRPYRLIVDSVESGQEAIELIKKGQVYDLILMDHMMPGLDGIETTKILHDMGYKQPIVAITANAAFGAHQLFMDNGFAGFISKPINLGKLDYCLMKFIYAKQSEEVIAVARTRFSEVKKDDKEVSPRLRQAFLIDASKTMEILEPISQMDTIGFDSFRAYTIQVHAIKSALLNVGRNELAAVAGELEAAGREENFDIVKMQTPSFLDDLQDVINALSRRRNDKN